LESGSSNLVLTEATMAIVDNHQRFLPRHRADWLSPVCLRLHQVAAAGSFAFILALVLGLI
jgi:hypothetical protein